MGNFSNFYRKILFKEDIELRKKRAEEEKKLKEAAKKAQEKGPMGMIMNY